MDTLRDALHDNIFNSGRPAKQIADELGISYSYLASAGNPNLEEFHFQLRHLIPLTKATGNYDTLDYIERTLGRVAFSVPAVGLVSEVAAETANIVREAGHLLTEMGKALEDGRIQSHEWPGIARECEHVISAVCRLREAAKREVSE
jgi:hypothetical protein